MKPEFEHDLDARVPVDPLVSRLPLGRVICGDNCEVMRQWPSQSIDLVVTSPPYDDLRTYGGHSWDFFGVAWNLKRLLKPGGVLVWVVADATKDGSETGTSMEQALHFKRIGFGLHQTMIYEKCSGIAGKLDAYRKLSEYMFVFFVPGGKVTANLLRDSPNKYAGKTNMSGGGRRKDNTKEPLVPIATDDFGRRSNIWRIPHGGLTSDVGHPATFPYALARDHIATWSNQGDIILDCFAGSGTTLKAAQDLGRLWVGIEINPDYIPICEARTAQASLDLVSG